MSARRRVDERDLGMAEYVSRDVPGIGGMLKKNASDFRVNEIDLNNCEVTLDDPAPMPVDDDDEDVDVTDDDGIVRFVVAKERMDTLAAVGNLSATLGVPVRAIGFAGLKDHRAVTAQELTVRGVAPAAVRAMCHPHFRVGKVRRVEHVLKLGQLGGNRFRIVLRGVQQVDSAALH